MIYLRAGQNAGAGHRFYNCNEAAQFREHRESDRQIPG